MHAYYFETRLLLLISKTKNGARNICLIIFLDTVHCDNCFSLFLHYARCVHVISDSLILFVSSAQVPYNYA